MRQTGTLVVVLAFAGLIGATPVGAGQVYGDGAMEEFCTRAQQIVARTDLVSTNVIQPTPEDFITSDAAPWDDADGLALPLTTQQFTSVVAHPTEDRDMATVVSCKMKSAEALLYHYGLGTAEIGGLCRDVHAEVVDDVFASLTPPERARLVYDRDDVFLDPDLVSWGGPDWTTPFPPQVAHAEPDGKLHLRAKAMIVPRIFPVPIVPTPKRGVHYCHLVAPDHLRELVTGDAEPIPAA